MVLFPKRGKRLDTDSPPYRIIILTVVVTTSTWDYLTFRPSSFWFPAVSLDKVLSPLSPDPTWQIVRRGGVFSYTGAFRTGIDGRAPLARPSHPGWVPFCANVRIHHKHTVRDANALLLQCWDQPYWLGAPRIRWLRWPKQEWEGLGGEALQRKGGVVGVGKISSQTSSPPSLTLGSRWCGISGRYRGLQSLGPAERCFVERTSGSQEQVQPTSTKKER